MGLRKVNISSDFKVAYYRAVGAYLDATGDFYPAKVLPHGMDEVKRVVRRKMELFGCMGRA